jgi:UPF0271 protein
MAVNKIDLNSDVGESFGNYRLGLDEKIIPLISSANIACGFHAGDPTVMKRTLAIAKEHGVFAAAQGMTLQHVKPHGALYNMATVDMEIWDAVAEVIAAVDSGLILFVMAGPWRQDLEAIGARHGIRIAFEFFGDRAYNPDGTLVSRKLPGAVIHDHEPVAEKVLKMVKEGKVVCIDGTEIELAAETICVHGDNPAALELVKNIRESLLEEGIEITAPATFLVNRYVIQ